MSFTMTSRTRKSNLPTINRDGSTFEADDFVDGGDFSLAYELRHFFRVMGFFGLYYTPKSWQMKSGASNWNRFLYRSQQAYCFLVHAIAWLNFIRIITGFWLGDKTSLQYKFVPLKAHDIGNYIHDIGVFDISKNEDVVQIHMFLSKLNGPPIAFTLWNILPITKEFILTVVGVFITYYALVAQTI
ncbi:uncharacterized protein [Amphiura filiformis]|uniref:uncharacterized protein isoform X1 n=1 Tax=Amphiura filiformis TaxID=82378 RepID=UPI003B210E5C